MRKHARLSAGLVLVALLGAGCLSDDEEPGAVTTSTRTGVTVPSPPDDPADPATPGGSLDPVPVTAPGTPTTASKPTATTAARPSSGAEANVIKGVVRDEQGDPVPGARITAAGYTGKGANKVETATSDAAGRYRLPVVEGLYNLRGVADVAFDGRTFKEMYLHPADGNCEQQMSAGGIVQDFVLRLTGLQTCYPAADPQNPRFYSGAALALVHQAPKTLPADAGLTFTLTPAGPLADGSAGRALTFTRTVAALARSSGPLEGTQTLHDIPLGRYTIAGHATLPGGARQELRFAAWDTAPGAPATSFTVTFDPVLMFPYGIRVRTISVHDAGAADPTPTPTSPPATAAPTTTTTTSSCPPDPSTGIPKCSPYW